MTARTGWVGALTRDELFNPALRSPADLLVDTRITGLEPDGLVGQMVWHADRGGKAQLGPLMDLLCGRSVITRLTPGQGARTANLRLDAMGPEPEDGVVITARAQVLSIENFAFSTAVATLPDGRAVAAAAGRFAVLDLGEQPSPPEPVLPGAGRPFEPLSIDADDAEVQLTFQPDHRIANSRNHGHGGTHFFFVDASARSALDHSAPGGPARLLDARIDFHRPMLLDGLPITCRARVEKMGRSLAVVTVTISNQSNKIISTGHVSYART